MDVIRSVATAGAEKTDGAAMLKVSFRKTAKEHVDAVVRLINEQHTKTGSVLLVHEHEVEEWARKGHSMIAINNGEVVGHQAVYVWPESQWVEFRSAVVKEEFRGQNINYKLKSAFILEFLENKPEIGTFVAVKNSSSNGMKILELLGFSQIKASEAPRELFTIGLGQDWNVLKLDLRR